MHLSEPAGITGADVSGGADAGVGVDGGGLLGLYMSNRTKSSGIRSNLL